MLPVEKNARRLIALAQYGAATSDELRAQAALPGPAFYEALRYAKERHWLVLRLDNDRLVYAVDSQAAPLEELPDEGLPDWNVGSNANGVAISSLVQIVGDNTASTRQRIRASAAVLGYRTQGDVSEFVQKYLQSVCESTDIAAIDYKIEAGELLRKHEAPRVISETVRPNYSGDSGGTEADRREAWRNYEIAARELKIILATKDTPLPGWADDLYSDDYVPPPEGWPGPPPRIPLKDLVVARKARQDRLCPESVFPQNISSELERDGDG